jgi:hypothetical protein
MRLIFILSFLVILTATKGFKLKPRLSYHVKFNRDNFLLYCTSESQQLERDVATTYSVDEILDKISDTDKGEITIHSNIS